jgi:LytS/YehU family sensor histidine kinase
MVLLLAFAVGLQWPHALVPSWLPRWLVPVLAVALAAPVATFAVYLLWVGGDVRAFVDSPGALMGFAWIAGTGLVVGLLLTLGTLVRERDAQARSQALQFALERATLERQALDARLSLLQAQIEPHFLFNTLANVQALVETGSPRAPAVLASLIAYLRAAMPRLQEREGTLGQELDLVRAYLDLMRMRMPDRLSFTIEADEALRTQRFPAMALLTLVENAVRHGIDPSEEGGRIAVRVARRGPTLEVAVEDSGVGLSETGGVAGTGLSNLRERIVAFFGPQARLELDGVDPHGLRAILMLPQETAA